eukprot:599820-Heterocapsa_arctica.AAC.1
MPFDPGVNIRYQMTETLMVGRSLCPIGPPQEVQRPWLPRRGPLASPFTRRAARLSAGLSTAQPPALGLGRVLSSGRPAPRPQFSPPCSPGAR